MGWVQMVLRARALLVCVREVTIAATAAFSILAPPTERVCRRFMCGRTRTPTCVIMVLCLIVLVMVVAGAGAGKKWQVHAAMRRVDMCVRVRGKGVGRAGLDEGREIREGDTHTPA